MQKTLNVGGRKIKIIKECQVCGKEKDEIEDGELTEHQGIKKCPRCRNEYLAGTKEESNDGNNNESADSWKEVVNA